MFILSLGYYLDSYSLVIAYVWHSYSLVYKHHSESSFTIAHIAYILSIWRCFMKVTVNRSVAFNSKKEAWEPVYDIHSSTGAYITTVSQGRLAKTLKDFRAKKAQDFKPLLRLVR